MPAAAFAGLALVLVAMAFPEVASAAFPGPNGRIAYLRESQGKGDIYTMDSGGGHKRRVARNATEPTYSANGRRLAFSRSREIASCKCRRPGVYVMRADGSAQRLVVGGPAATAEPAFSPSGRRLVFASAHAGRNGIYTARLDGSHVRRVVGGRFVADPEFSPDGQEIVFDRRC